MKFDIFLKKMAYIPLRIFLLILASKQTFTALLKIKNKINKTERGSKNPCMFQLHKTGEKQIRK